MHDGNLTSMSMDVAPAMPSCTAACPSGGLKGPGSGRNAGMGCPLHFTNGISSLCPFYILDMWGNPLYTDTEQIRPHWNAQAEA